MRPGSEAEIHSESWEGKEREDMHTTECSLVNIIQSPWSFCFSSDYSFHTDPRAFALPVLSAIPVSCQTHFFRRVFPTLTQTVFPTVPAWPLFVTFHGFTFTFFFSCPQIILLVVITCFWNYWTPPNWTIRSVRADAVFSINSASGTWWGEADRDQRAEGSTAPKVKAS